MGTATRPPVKPLRPPEPPSVLALVADLLRRPWVNVDARHYLDDYLQTQWLAPAALADRQLALLRRVAWHCYLHVPAHQRRLGERLRPHQIEHLQHVSELPVARGDERRAQPDAFRATTSESIAGQRTTAGTRGAAVPVFLDDEVDARQTALRMRAERWAGAPPSQVVAAWGRTAIRERRPLDEAEVRAMVLASGRSPFSRTPAVVTAPGASYVRLLPALAGTTLRSVIVRGEDARGDGARLAEATGARLHRIYAAAETGIIAASCEQGGMHVAADHVIVEIVDEQDRPAAPGAIGRVVVTDLFNRAAPYLRHDLGDRGRLVTGGCGCGRALPLLEVLGRL
jgi:phenylacetate-CoA ligase